MENIISNLSCIMIAIAIICTFVSVVTELTKEIGFLNKIPTSAQVTVISVIVTIITLVAYASYKSIQIRWYYIFAAIIVGVFIAFITMYGWDALIKRFKEYYKSDLK